jgi:AraC-like DNA-binding protein
LKIHEYDRELEGRFHSLPVPSIAVRPRPSTNLIVFSHVVANSPTPEKTLAPPPEAAFAIHVHHRVLPPLETWIGGTHAFSPLMGPGGMCVFDLLASPLAIITQPLDFSRLEIKGATLSELAYHRGISALNVNVPPFGHDDPIICDLALALKSRLDVFGQEPDSVFADSVALALVDRFLSAYVGAAPIRTARGRLSEGHYRRVSEVIDARMAGSLSLSEIASAVDMPPERFAKAFKKLTGIPVHRWLTMKRVEKAKDLLTWTNLSLSQIAVECGFVDQSHFTRVLRKHSATTPRKWRSNSRN